MPPFGKPLERTVPSEIILKPGDVGYCEISAETEQAIAEIESNVRSAKANAHQVWLD